MKLGVMKLACVYKAVSAGYILERQGMRVEWAKRHILVNLGQFKDETPLNSMQIYSFWSKKIQKKLKKCIVAIKV